jgi:ABC-type branched-subunit amino acid transport system permease subunit
MRSWLWAAWVAPRATLLGPFFSLCSKLSSFLFRPKLGHAGLIGDSYIRHIFLLVFIWCIGIASWVLILGYAGIFNYAQLVFFIFGAYGSAMLSIYSGLTPLLAFAVLPPSRVESMPAL